MNTLIINNGSKHLLDLQKLFIDSQATIEWTQIQATNIAMFDLIILSGSSNLSVVKDFKILYKNEVNLILTSNKPLIGICFGCELIAYTFGAKLKKLNSKQKGVSIIKPVNGFNIFKGLAELKVYEAHRWSITSLTEELEVIAISNAGIEIFRHKERPMYGLQFHPEEFCDKLMGDEILLNIVKLLV